MIKKLIVQLLLITFLFTSVGPLPEASAQSILELPAPGVMVNTSVLFQPLQLKGVLVNPKNPLRFDFLIDKGDSGLSGQSLKDEITRLAKYFLTCLTVPENDLWVNLSPYEKDRIVPGNFGITLMGKDLLEQDYLLKQIMASLSYPENDLGKEFWQKVYHKSYELYGTTEIPINTFNKVWIIPKSAQVYAQGNTAFVVKSQLEVMLEADYKSFVHHWGHKNSGVNSQGFSQNAGAYSQVFRDVILPELRQEINEGKNFAVVRQVYNAMILATWYKRHLKDSILGRDYVGKNKVLGVDIADKDAKEKIFRLYLKAYKKCVYNYIREDYDPVTQQTVPRKYASGGMNFINFAMSPAYKEVPNAKGMRIGHDLAMATVNFTAVDGNRDVMQFPDIRTEDPRSPLIDYPGRSTTFFNKYPKKPFNSQAMLSPFWQRWILPLGLAIVGLGITPKAVGANALHPRHPTSSGDFDRITFDADLSKLRLYFKILGRPWSDKDSIEKVMDLQRYLTEKGYYSGAINGNLGPLTFKAIEKAAKSSDSDRITFDADLSKLKLYFKILGRPWSDKDTQERVMDLQKYLKKKGYYSGQITGNLGPLTFKAIEKAAKGQEGETPETTPSLNESHTTAQQGSSPQPKPLTPQTSTKKKASAPTGTVAATQSAGSSGGNPPLPTSIPQIIEQSDDFILTAPAPATFTVTASGTPAPSYQWIQSTNEGESYRPITGATKPSYIITTTTAANNRTKFKCVVRNSAGFVISNPITLTVYPGNPPPPPKETGAPLNLTNPLITLISPHNSSSNFTQYVAPGLIGLGILGLSFGAAYLVTMLGPGDQRLNSKASQKPVSNAAPTRNRTPPAANPNAPVIPRVVIQGPDEQDPTTSATLESIKEDQTRYEQWLKNLKSRGMPNSAMISTAIPVDKDFQSSRSVSWSDAILSIGAVRLFNALYSTSNLWMHEVAHAVGAASVYWGWKNWKKALSPSNLMGNLTFSQWKEYFLSKLNGTAYEGDDPYVSFPASGWRDKFISKFGLGFTVLSNGMFLAGLSAISIQNPWLLPVLGVAAYNVLSVIRDAWEGDKNGSLAGENGERLYFCRMGLVVHIGTRRALAAQGNQSIKGRAEDIARRNTTAGNHGVGALTIRDDKNGNVHTTVAKETEILRGPWADPIPIVMNQLDRTSPPIIGDGPNANEYIADPWLIHNRLSSKGKSKRKNLHPQGGHDSEEHLWSIENGILTEGKNEQEDLSVAEENIDSLYGTENQKDSNRTQKVNARLTLNGDLNEFKPLVSDPRYVKKLSENLELSRRLTHSEGDLPDGDTITGALYIKYLRGQGRPAAAFNWAYVNAHIKRLEELNDNLLTEDENMLGAQPFRRALLVFRKSLSWPTLKKPAITLSDLYISKEKYKEIMRKNVRTTYEEEAVIHYERLNDFKAYLVEQYKEADRAGQLPDKMTRHWRGADADQVMRRFVEFMVYKFLTGDRNTAVREYRLGFRGEAGLVVIDPSERDGFTLLSVKMGMFYGVDEKNGRINASSDPYALIDPYRDGSKLDYIIPLNPQGLGEQANFKISKKDGAVSVRIYSFQKGRYLSDEEINRRRVPLKGKYYFGLFKYKDPRRMAMEEWIEYTKVLNWMVHSLDLENAKLPPSRQPLNYQSAVALGQRLLAYWYYLEMRETMWHGGLHGRLRKIIKQLAQQCGAANVCTAKQKRFLEEESEAEVKHSRLIAIVDSQLFDHYAMDLARQRAKGDLTPEEVKKAYPKIIRECEEYFTGLLTKEKLSEIFKLWARERISPFAKRLKTAIAIIGDINSDTNPRTAADIWQALFPEDLPVVYFTSQQIMQYKKRVGLNIPVLAAAIVTSETGINFNTNQALEVLIDALGLDKIWGLTGIPFSPMTFNMGQSLDPDLPFNGHLFYYGTDFQSHQKGATGSLVSAFHMQLPIVVAMLLHQWCPDEKPFGLDLTPERLEYLDNLRKNMPVSDSIRITGRDTERRPVETSENRALVKRGEFLAHRLMETPAANYFATGAVYIIFMCGAYILNLLKWRHLTIGAPLESWSGLIVANLDFLLARFGIPRGFTYLYRLATGYDPLERLGQPTLCVIGKDGFPLGHEMLLRNGFSRSYSGWAPQQIMAETYEEAIARAAVALPSNSLVLMDIPPTPRLRSMAIDVGHQVKVTRMPRLWGIRRIFRGATVLSTGRDPVNDPDATDNHIVIGGADQFLPPEGDELSEEVFGAVNANSMNSAEGYTLSVMFDQLTQEGKLHNPNINAAHFRTLSTQNAVAAHPFMPFADNLLESDHHGPKPAVLGHTIEVLRLHEQHSPGVGHDPSLTQSVLTIGVVLSERQKENPAQLTRDGGINMSSRLMQLNVSGGTQNDRIKGGDTAMASMAIKGVVPQVSGIVTVTPEMLKSMLGEGYLN